MKVAALVAVSISTVSAHCPSTSPYLMPGPGPSGCICKAPNAHLVFHGDVPCICMNPDYVMSADKTICGLSSEEKTKRYKLAEDVMKHDIGWARR